MQQTYNFFAIMTSVCGEKSSYSPQTCGEYAFYSWYVGWVDEWTSGRVNQLFVDRVSKDRVTGEQGFLKLTSRRVDELTSCLQR